MNLAEIADALDAAPRRGAAVDKPEGVRHALLSDTLLQRMARDLRLAAAERLEAEEFGGRRERQLL